MKNKMFLFSIIMNALAYQADPTSVTLKVSPHKAKKVGNKIINRYLSRHFCRAVLTKCFIVHKYKQLEKDI
jgi:hypothetical protein